MCFATRLRGERGQSSVEAAVTLPVLMLLFALLMQPVCALYTLMVMRHAAAETTRVLATTSDEQTCREFAIRRLRAVPNSSLFHVGGDEDWSVVTSTSEGRSVCKVEIRGHLRPMPLFGVATQLLGKRDSTGIELCAKACERVRPRWLGGDYSDWMQAW